MIVGDCRALAGQGFSKRNTTPWRIGAEMPFTKVIEGQIKAFIVLIAPRGVTRWSRKWKTNRQTCVEHEGNAAQFAVSALLSPRKAPYR